MMIPELGDVGGGGWSLITLPLQFREFERSGDGGGGGPLGTTANAELLSGGGLGFDLGAFFGGDSQKNQNNSLFDLLLGLGLSQRGIGDITSNLFSGIEV